MNERLPQRLISAREHQNSYVPNEDVAREIGSKVLILLVGPTAVGKSTIIADASQRENNFSIVKTHTTRAPREGEVEEQFVFVEPSDAAIDALLDDIEDGDVVNYAVHPSTDALYVTYVDGYQTRYCALPALASGVRQLQALPFERVETIALLTNPDAWSDWIDIRSATMSQGELEKRLAEAEQSLKWLIEHGEKIKWVENRYNDPYVASNEVIDIAERGKGGERYDEGMLLALDLLERVRDKAAEVKGY